MLPDQLVVVAERANHAAKELGRFMGEVGEFVRKQSPVWASAEDGGPSIEHYERFAEDGERLRNLFVEAYMALDIEVSTEYPLMIVSACYQLAYVTDPAVTTPTYADLVSLTDLTRIHVYIGQMQQFVLLRASSAIGRQVAQN